MLEVNVYPLLVERMFEYKRCTKLYVAVKARQILLSMYWSPALGAFGINEANKRGAVSIIYNGFLCFEHINFIDTSY